MPMWQTHGDALFSEPAGGYQRGKNCHKMTDSDQLDVTGLHTIGCDVYPTVGERIQIVRPTSPMKK
jgi:hypothetical protein